MRSSNDLPPADAGGSLRNDLNGARPFCTTQVPHPPLNAFRNAVKTGGVSLQGRPPHRPERVSKRRENRRLGCQERTQEPIVMGSWLFSSNACNISSCELWTHPGAHRLVYVRRPSELSAFRNAMKSAPAKGGAAVCPTHLDAFRKALNTVADS